MEKFSKEILKEDSLIRIKGGQVDPGTITNTSDCTLHYISGVGTIGDSERDGDFYSSC